ncbi:unnamed protein product [Bathycoccus prasinos]
MIHGVEEVLILLFTAFRAKNFLFQRGKIRKLSLVNTLVASTHPVYCKESIPEYSGKCEKFWYCTARELLKDVGQPDRSKFAKFDIAKIGHTPMWLRISNRTLYCVVHPQFDKRKYRMKTYRALHYLNRLNRILENTELYIPDGTEWWTHHSDWTKVRKGSSIPPVFAVSGAYGFEDIAGIPFMSFSDKISQVENEIFKRDGTKRYQKWENKRQSAFFRGSLSDCANAIQNHDGDIRYCARAKIIYEGATNQNRILDGVSSTTDFKEAGLNMPCHLCTSKSKSGESFIHELLSHRYVLNFPGAGNWSRRMSLLLRSGGLVLQAESSGYQFYEYALKPGIHYIPFDPQIGEYGTGNLLSRLYWARENEAEAHRIAQRSKSFGDTCLKEESIDYFVATLLTEYSKKLQGAAVNLPVIDLSKCISTKSKKGRSTSIARLCKSTINLCWK